MVFSHMSAIQEDAVSTAGSKADAPTDEDSDVVMIEEGLATDSDEPEDAPPAPMKRPAARKAKRCEQCVGSSREEPCKFSTTIAGQPARAQSSRGESTCVFCSRQTFERAAGSPKSKLVQMLKKIHALDPANSQRAVHQIEAWFGTERADFYRGKLGLPPVKSEWPELLQHRQLARASLDENEVETYEAAVRADRRQVRRKVLCPEYKGKHGTKAQDEREVKKVTSKCGPLSDVAANDAGLPAPADAQARMLEHWCKRGSWAMCEKCHAMQPRNLEPGDLKKVAGATVSAKACAYCKLGERVPQPEDIPVPLRGLAPEVLEALRPLEVDTGPEVRAPNGYRNHMAPMTFAWAPTTVEKKIKALDTHEARVAARAALKHLLRCRKSDYFHFYEKHQEFLKKKGEDADLKDRKRPLRFIEQSGQSSVHDLSAG